MTYEARYCLEKLQREWNLQYNQFSFAVFISKAFLPFQQTSINISLLLLGISQNLNASLLHI